MLWLLSSCPSIKIHETFLITYPRVLTKVETQVYQLTCNTKQRILPWAKQFLSQVSRRTRTCRPWCTRQVEANNRKPYTWSRNLTLRWTRETPTSNRTCITLSSFSSTINSLTKKTWGRTMITMETTTRTERVTPKRKTSKRSRGSYG